MSRIPTAEEEYQMRLDALKASKAVRRVTVEFEAGKTQYTVREGDAYVYGICFGEMLEVVIALTRGDASPYQMRTFAAWQEYDRLLAVRRVLE